MAKVLVVANNKGGVGKTFLSKTLAEYAALERDMRVLLIDLDPQTNLSRRYLKMNLQPHSTEEWQPPLHPDYDPNDPGNEDWNGISSSADIWRHGFAVPYPTQLDNIEIIPASSETLQAVEHVTRQDVFDKVIRHFRDFIRLEENQADYDLIVIDTRPSKGPLTSAAAFAASHIVIPTEMEAPSLEGLFGMLALIQSINLERKDNDRLKLVGLLPNKVKAALSLHQKNLELYRNHNMLGQYVLPLELRDWSEYRNSMQFESDSIFRFPASAKERVQAGKVCGWILDRIQGDVK